MNNKKTDNQNSEAVSGVREETFEEWLYGWYESSCEDCKDFDTSPEAAWNHQAKKIEALEEDLDCVTNELNELTDVAHNLEKEIASVRATLSNSLEAKEELRENNLKINLELMQVLDRQREDEVRIAQLEKENERLRKTAIVELDDTEQAALVQGIVKENKNLRKEKDSIARQFGSAKEASEKRTAQLIAALKKAEEVIKFYAEKKNKKIEEFSYIGNGIASSGNREIDIDGGRKAFQFKDSPEYQAIKHLLEEE